MTWKTSLPGFAKGILHKMGEASLLRELRVFAVVGKFKKPEEELFTNKLVVEAGMNDM